MSVEEIERRLWPEPIELQLVAGNSLENHPEIYESTFEITDNWWNSMRSTEPGSRDKRESLENCEDYIDFMYDKPLGTLPHNMEIPRIRSMKNGLTNRSKRHSAQRICLVV